MLNFRYHLIYFRYLNQAMQVFDATIVVPTNFVFFTISAIVAGENIMFL